MEVFPGRLDFFLGATKLGTHDKSANPACEVAMFVLKRADLTYCVFRVSEVEYAYSASGYTSSFQQYNVTISSSAASQIVPQLEIGDRGGVIEHDIGMCIDGGRQYTDGLTVTKVRNNVQQIARGFVLEFDATTAYDVNLRVLHGDAVVQARVVC